MANAIDKFADMIGLGPNSWDERLRPTIDLTSPDGDAYSAKWVGDSRSQDKKLGLFEFPFVRGTIAQDLDVSSSRYSIRIYFDGNNNDKTAESFWKSCKQRGTWTITHPVYGFIDVQLVSVSQDTQPIDNGGITAFDTEWIEPIDEKTLMTAREMIDRATAQTDKFNAQAIQQFADNIRATTEGLRGYIESATQLVVNANEVAFAPINAVTDGVNSLVNETALGIEDIFMSSVFEAQTLGAQMVELCQLPVLATTNIRSRLDAYDDMVESTLDILERTQGLTSEEAIDNALVCELTLSACVGGYAKSIISGELDTRENAVALATRYASMLTDVTNSLDLAQDDMTSMPITKQYFSQSQAYADALQLLAMIQRYILISVFDLSVAKRFTLDRDRSPIDVVLTEFGELGDGDTLLDFFIFSNSLYGDELLLMRSGREVVVYV